MHRPYRRRHFERRAEPPVEDLREKLNRMKLERAAGNSEGTRKPPPPDPSYNFLKDPLRGDDCSTAPAGKKSPKNKSSKSEAKSDGKNDNVEPPQEKNVAHTADKGPRPPRNTYYESRRGPPPREWGRQNWGPRPAAVGPGPRKPQERTKQPPKLQPASNIKVEVTIESGERKCTFDEEKTVQVPSVPKNRTYTVKPKWGRWSYRGPPNYYGFRNRQKPETFNKGKKNGETPKESLEDENKSVGDGKKKDQPVTAGDNTKKNGDNNEAKTNTSG